MANYCVNSNPQPSSGDHEVHILDGTCTRLPNPENRVALGDHLNCQSAVEAAKKIYPSSDGCYYCCEECNTG